MPVVYTPMSHVWTPLDFDGGADVQARMLDILESWEGTRYLSGQDCRGVGADCIGFGFRVIDELYRRPTPDRPKLPADTSMHNRVAAARTMRLLRKLYMPNKRVLTRELQPLDLIVTGPSTGGPGHLMLVGPRKNTIWQAIQGPGVSWTGWSLPDEWRLFRVYRFEDRERWK